MIKGIYKAASGMVPRMKKQEITANNIANASTPGYKKDSTFIKELDTATKSILPRKSDWQTPMIDQIYTDYSQGTFNKTGNPLDVAIEGEGFFVLESIDGGDRQYSRNGSFSVDIEGFLISSSGFRVMGEGGPIEAAGGMVEINESGQLMIDGNITDRLQIVNFEDKSILGKVGSSGFMAPEDAGPLPAEGFSVRQGFLENSNINVIKEMVGMIITLRNFETGARMIQSQDESLKTLFTQVGKTRM
ncbi:MAG: flagellar basal-body rod protein FlgF [candidate division Zixibacteria bacterium]